jgi:REP element-mobilizing transposase RayT
MPPPHRRWLYHVPPTWAADSTYFITVCCQTRGANQLCNSPVAEQLLAAVHHYHTQLRWHVSLWLLMPDHLHALVSCPRSEDLAKVVAAWKRFTARETGIVWQRGFFDHRLRGDESWEEKAHYIRMNPVRKGFVAEPEIWPHVWSPESSPGRDFR